jgi:hypothetical protein
MILIGIFVEISCVAFFWRVCLILGGRRRSHGALRRMEK